LTYPANIDKPILKLDLYLLIINNMRYFMKKLILMILSSFFAGFITISAAFAENLSATNKAGDKWIEPITDMEFVWVPKGCFMMGSSS
jgi:hypothetical protein